MGSAVVGQHLGPTHRPTDADLSSKDRCNNLEFRSRPSGFPQSRCPNLGTHFGGHGTFQIGEGDIWLNNFSMYDALGNKVRMEGALVHNDFEDWNFDASIVETPTPLLLMNLPKTTTMSPLANSLSVDR